VPAAAAAAAVTMMSVCLVGRLKLTGVPSFAPNYLLQCMHCLTEECRAINHYGQDHFQTCFWIRVRHGG
jgi:hypothetical protein